MMMTTITLKRIKTWLLEAIMKMMMLSLMMMLATLVEQSGAFGNDDADDHYFITSSRSLIIKHLFIRPARVQCLRYNCVARSSRASAEDGNLICSVIYRRSTLKIVH